MTIQQLEYVLSLDTHRHFVKASEACFVTQPTITTQLKKLEDEIGIQIFDRSSTPLVPTHQGEIIIERARVILGEIYALKELVSTERESIQGSFRLGVIPTIAPGLLPGFLQAMSQKYPETDLSIEEMQSDAMINAIKSNRLDIGLLVTPIDEPSIREVHLYNEPFVYYGDKEDVFGDKEDLLPSDVENLDGLWLLSEGHCFRNQVLNICHSKKKKNKGQFQSGSIETLKRIVDKNGGFTLIPEMSVAPQDKARSLNFKDPKPVREVSFVVSKGFFKDRLLDVLRSEILELIPSSFEQNDRYFRVKWR